MPCFLKEPALFKCHSQIKEGDHLALNLSQMFTTYEWVREGPEEGQEDKMSLYPGRVLEHEGQPDEEEGGQGDVQLDYGHNGPE
jgi:hypothetical protein